MPSTRRQVAKLKAKKVIAIPVKYDTSLFQKKGDCIEGMPIPIFQFIQKFLNEQDYLDLMNSNLSTFQPIKYETVHYTLVGPERWIDFDFCADEHKEAAVLQIISSVKDKSKQISMRIKGVTQSTLLKYAHLYEGIGKLTVEQVTIENDFRFPVFHKIRHLKLSGIGGGFRQQPLQANFDLEDLETLELNHCRFKEIVAWNSSKSLKTVTIRGCSPLSSIPALDDIPVVSITATTSLTHFQSKGNHKKFSFVGSTLDKESLQLISQPLFCNGLQALSLWCTFNIPDLSFCQNIPVVDLYNSSGGYRNDLYPSLPLLNGEVLKLQHFSLGSWNGLRLSKVVKCELWYCIDLVDFPEMEALQSLKLQKCDHLVGIPSLSSLKDLWMTDCPKMKRVSYSPCLTKVSVERCQNFEDLSAFSHVQDVSLFNCDRVTSILPLQRVRSVTVRVCAGITDLERISNPQDDYLLAKRKITLSGVRVPHQLQNIYHLVLERFATESPDLSLIGNVHHLEIRNCFSLTTTKGLHTVTGSLILERCPKLTSLVGLENIPEISISFCSSIFDFTGLGHHKKLTVRGNSVFEKMLKGFQKENKHSELFESIEHLYFHSQGYYPTAKCIW
jgi:hypothetical protein